jgi:hypothetical protein
MHRTHVPFFPCLGALARARRKHTGAAMVRERRGALWPPPATELHPRQPLEPALGERALFSGEAARQRRQFMVAGTRDASWPSDLNRAGAYPFGLSAGAGRPPMGRSGSRLQRPGRSPGLLLFFRKCPVI